MTSAPSHMVSIKDGQGEGAAVTWAPQEKNFTRWHLTLNYHNFTLLEQGKKKAQREY